MIMVSDDDECYDDDDDDDDDVGDGYIDGKYEMMYHDYSKK